MRDSAVVISNKGNKFLTTIAVNDNNGQLVWQEKEGRERL
jgi:hypothetical protein